MTQFVADLVERNGPDAETELVISLARQHFIILDAVAAAINLPVDALSTLWNWNNWKASKMEVNPNEQRWPAFWPAAAQPSIRSLSPRDVVVWFIDTPKLDSVSQALGL